MMLDLLIKGGLIVDGTGAPGFVGDVGISDGVIVETGEISTPARRTIDAAGLTVTPGFIDIHTHYDGQASWDSYLAPSSLHGVTSLVYGNCGVGFAPARPDKHAWLINLLEGVEDIPGTALAEGLTWDWETFPDYLDALERRRFAVDIGAQVPHAPLRAYVMGDRGADPDAVPSEDEIAGMARHVAESLEAGALGFSTSRTIVHRTRDGASIGTLRAGEAELMRIAGALSQSGRGVIQLISDAYMTTDDAFADAELDLIARLATVAGRKVSVTVQQTDSAPDRWRHMFRSIEAMRAIGLDVRAQVAPRPIGGLLGHATSINPFVFTPTYQQLAKLPPAEKVTRLRDPEIRRCILAEHDVPIDQPFGGMLTHGFAKMFRITDPVDYEPDASRSLNAEAQRLGRDIDDYAYDVFLEEDGARLVYMPSLNYARGDLGDVHEMMCADFALFGLSDGGAHCGAICDASFPTTAIALWSRGDKSGRAIPLEQLVQGYTQRNAAHVGWLDRGVVAPGYIADLNIIDLQALSLRPAHPVHDLPAGGMRLLQEARGYRWTIKRGLVTFENGKPAGELPGRLVRGGQAAPTVRG